MAELMGCNRIYAEFSILDARCTPVPESKVQHHSLRTRVEEPPECFHVRATVIYPNVNALVCSLAPLPPRKAYMAIRLPSFFNGSSRDEPVLSVARRRVFPANRYNMVLPSGITENTAEQFFLGLSGG